MAVELPTAFPYFGALAAVIGARPQTSARKVFLILLFNVCFVAAPAGDPRWCLTVAGDRAEVALIRVSAFLQRRWPVLLAVVAVIAGVITIGLGATGTYRAATKLLHKAVKVLHTAVKVIK